MHVGRLNRHVCYVTSFLQETTEYSLSVNPCIARVRAWSCPQGFGVPADTTSDMAACMLKLGKKSEAEELFAKVSLCEVFQFCTRTIPHRPEPRMNMS